MLWAVLSGFALAVAAPWLHRTARGGAGLVLGIGPALLFAYFLHFLPAIAAGETIRQAWPWVPALDITLSFYLDGLSLLFALLISGIGAVIAVYAGTYFAEDPNRGRFYVSLLAFMASMLGLVLSDNVISLFVFWELTSLTSYLLIGYDHERREARDNALQALLVTGIGGLALLAGLVLLALITGSWELSALLNQRELIVGHPLYPAALLCVLAGAFTKSAQFPFHFWLPNAMVAPTPVSAYLHSSTMVKAGVYLLARLSPGMGGTAPWTGLLVGIGGVTMLLGAVLAIRQGVLKRVLAYSTVSALGILVALIGLAGTADAAAAGYASVGFAAFLLAHALYKAGLFLVAGTITHETGESELAALGGLRAAMPFTAAAAAVAALSMAAIPPFLGFLGKELLFEATLGQPRWAGVMTLAVMLSGACFVLVGCLVGWRPFFGAPPAAGEDPHEAPPAMWVGPAVLGLLGLAVGLFPAVFGDPVVGPAAASLQLAPALAGARADAIREVHLALWHGVNPALAAGAVAFALGIAAYALHGRLVRVLDVLTPPRPIGPERGYRALFEGTLRLARAQTRLFQSGYLRSYVAILIAAFVALVGAGLYTAGARGIAPDFAEVRLHEIGLAVLIMAAALAAVTAKRSLGAVAAMGVIGYGVALLYVNFGAPDLAMTQFAIETVTVIFFVLVFYHLPPFRHDSDLRVRLKDIAGALVFGVLMTLLVLTAVEVQYAEPISGFFAQQSYEAAHGRNIVNVILVDFRALDTLGEITVVGLAGIGVYALLKLRARVRQEGGR